MTFQRARRLALSGAVSGLALAALPRTTLAQGANPAAPDARERISRSVSLVELGLADGARLSGLGGARDFYFPAPKGARLSGATLSLSYETASSTESRRGVEVIVGERTVRLHPIASTQERDTLQIPLDGLNVTNGFVKLTIRYGGLLDDKCVDPRFAADHLTVLPDTTFSYSVERNALDSISAALTAMPRPVDVYVPSRTLTSDEFAAALIAAKGLRQKGHEVRFKLLPSADLTSSIPGAGPPSIAGALTFAPRAQPAAAATAQMARFYPQLGLPPSASPATPEPGQAWSRGSVIVATPADLRALGADRPWNGEKQGADIAAASEGAPGAGVSLVRFGVGPAIFVGGDRPRTAARLIASPTRSAAVKADVSALVPARAPLAPGQLTFDRLQTDLGARSVVDRASWTVSIGGKDLPFAERISGMRVDVAVAPDEARSNAVVSAFFNERLMDSVTTDNNVMARLRFDVPRGMAGLNNNLRVVVQRQPRGGECLTMPTGSPAQLLDSSAVVTTPSPDGAHDFFELAPRFRNGVTFIVESGDAASQLARLATLSELTQELVPDGAPVEVVYAEPGATPRPPGPFIALTSRPPEHAFMPVRLDQGRAIIRGQDGATIADLGKLGDTLVAQVAQSGGDSGLWIRAVADTRDMAIPASARLDRGNAAIIDRTGVAFAFSSERDRLVEIAYPDKSSMAELANAWRPWIVGALWLASSLLLVMGALRFYRPKSGQAKS